MKRKWRGLVVGGAAIEMMVALAAPGCGSSPTKNRVPIPYSEAGASGEGHGEAGASPSAGSSGSGAVSGSGATGGDSGSPSDAGAAGITEGGSGGTGGTAGASGGGGAPLTGCALGEACCAGNLCESSLACLGSACSCVADLSNYYMVRTDGIAFFTDLNTHTQTVVSNADTASPLHGIKQIMGSWYYGCAALDTGEARCWLVGAGNTNSSGQLGNGTVSNTAGAVLSATLVKTSTGTLSNVVAIGSDSITWQTSTACAATADGSLYCWGDYRTQIIPGATDFVPFATKLSTSATGPALSGVTQVALGVTHACALTNGKVRCWGQGTGTLPARSYPDTDIVLPPTAGSVLKIVAGYSLSCALTSGDGGSVYCWGDNNGGKLGIGDPALVGYSSDTPVRAKLSDSAPLNNVTDLVASYDGACVVRTDHSLLCWGSGMYYATPMAVGGVPKTADNVAITDAAILSAPNNSTMPRYTTTSGVEYSQGVAMTPNCSIQE